MTKNYTRLWRKKWKELKKNWQFDKELQKSLIKNGNRIEKNWKRFEKDLKKIWKRIEKDLKKIWKKKLKQFDKELHKGN